jgi:hypothetical protein
LTDFNKCRSSRVNPTFYISNIVYSDRLCGLVIRVPGYRSIDFWFDFRRYQIFCEAVSLERGPFSIVRITEELLEWKSSGFGFTKSKLTAVRDPLR